ncbi:MAG TPA: protein kinase [Candidatus Hydrogenedens sp.]|nr:protein kinase [Candidatus Hydrogenedens sp.]
MQEDLDKTVRKEENYSSENGGNMSDDLVDKTVIKGRGDEVDKTVIKGSVEEIDRTVIKKEGDLQTPIGQGESKTTGIQLRRFRDYEVVEELPACGGEADIYRVRGSDGKDYALKLYRRGMDPKPEILRQVQELSHRYKEHLVYIYEVEYDEEMHRWYELMEYAKYGNLRDYSKNHKIDIRAVIRELNEAIYTLHDSEVIHRDIKPTNILVREENPLDLIFTDFGVSSVIDAELSKKMTTVKGTSMYSAPESFSGIIGREVDYWSLGMIFYELVLGSHPFTGLNERLILYRLFKEEIEIPEEAGEYRELLMGLLTRNKEYRWGYDEVRRWLLGDRDIPVKRSAVVDKKGYAKPYKFLGKQYRDLEGLAEAFIRSEKSFVLAIKLLGRGNIRRWLEYNKNYDLSVWIEKLLEGSVKESKVIRFVYTVRKDLPFSLYGNVVNVEFLVDLLVRHEVKVLESGRETIYGRLERGILRKIYNEYVSSSGKRDEKLERFFSNYEYLMGLNGDDRKEDGKTMLLQLCKVYLDLREIGIDKEEYLPYKQIDISERDLKDIDEEVLRLIVNGLGKIGKIPGLSIEEGERQYNTKKYEEAWVHFGLLSMEGDSKAKFYLGRMYEKGSGVKKNYVKAMEWYKKSSEQGNKEAQDKLDDMYQKCNGVKKDQKKVKKSIPKSIEPVNTQPQTKNDYSSSESIWDISESIWDILSLILFGTIIIVVVVGIAYILLEILLQVIDTIVSYISSPSFFFSFLITSILYILFISHNSSKSSDIFDIAPIFIMIFCIILSILTNGC